MHKLTDIFQPHQRLTVEQHARLPYSSASLCWETASVALCMIGPVAVILPAPVSLLTVEDAAIRAREREHASERAREQAALRPPIAREFSSLKLTAEHPTYYDHNSRRCAPTTTASHGAADRSSDDGACGSTYHLAAYPVWEWALSWVNHDPILTVRLPAGTSSCCETRRFITPAGFLLCSPVSPS